MMLNPAKLLFAIGVAGALTTAPSARAERCDVIDNFNNQTGALTVSGYGFDGAVDGGRKLRTPERGGACQEGNVNMVSAPPATTSDVGDGMVRRVIDIHANVSNPRTFTTRFKVKMPVLTGAPNNPSLVFRDMEFTPPNSDMEQPPVHLRFSISSWNAGASWNLGARLNFLKYGQLWEVELAGINLPTTQPQEFEVLVEYTQTWVPAQSNWIPKIVVTHFRGGNFYLKREFTMPVGMEPIEQSQGLLAQDQLPAGKLFAVTNCDPYICLPPK